MAEPQRKSSLAAWAWLLVVGLAVFELVAQALISIALPTDRSWEEASELVRARFEPGDRIVSAPNWIDPIVRHHLGDLLSLRAAAPSDLAGARRIWELGIRGERTRQGTPALERAFGEVSVRMWPVSGEEVLYDFVEEVRNASAEIEAPEGVRACPWTTTRPDRGGLLRGPMTPAERFVCDPRRPWLWVGATVMADLELQPRRCVWQHPTGGSPVRVTYSDVPIGDSLSIRAGVDYNNERWLVGAPVTMRVWIGDRLAGELVHRDGDGWSGVDIDTSTLGAERASVRFETTAPDPRARLFCWAASTRRGAANE